MTELTQTQTRFSNGIRLLGYSLLLVGFLWLCASAVLLPVHVVAATSRFMSEGLPRKESYTYTEVFDALARLSHSIRDELPWVLPPALLMLCGGLFLAWTPKLPR